MSSDGRWRIALLALVSGCLEHAPLAPGSSAILVHAVLNPTQTVQHVVVARTTNGTSFTMEISNALVQLTTPDGRTLVGTEVRSASDTTPFQYPPPPIPRYDIASGPIAAGQPYHLHVVLPTGEMIDGDATAPNAPSTIELPARTIDPARDTLRLAWPRVAGARAYEVRVSTQPDSVYPAGEAYVGYADTSVVLPGRLENSSGGAVFDSRFGYDIVVSAVDANYYEYYAHESDPFTSTSVPTSLRGALGVFGAIVPVLRMTVKVGGR